MDAAALAFEKRDAEPADTGAEASEAETPAEADATDPNADPDGATEADTDEAPAMADVEYDGFTLSVPADKAPELQKALLRQADYSRKMTDVSLQREAADARLKQAERLAEGAGQYAQAMAETQLIDAQLKQFDGVNWQQLRQENPGEYAAVSADLQSLRLAKQAAEAKVQGVGRTVQEAKSAAFAEKRAAMDEALKKSLPGWGNELGETLTQYAVTSGMQRETLDSLTDPVMVIALEKARKFDALQASKSALQTKIKGVPPVLRPGAPRKQDAHTDAMARLRKSNSTDDAAAAFLSKMR